MPRSNWIVRRIAEILEAPGAVPADDPIHQQMELGEAIAEDLGLLSPDDLPKALQYAKRLSPSVQARMLAMLMGAESPRLPHSFLAICKNERALVWLEEMQETVRKLGARDPLQELVQETRASIGLPDSWRQPRTTV